MIFRGSTACATFQNLSRYTLAYIKAPAGLSTSTLSRRLPSPPSTLRHTVSAMSKSPLPECWGHRGVSCLTPPAPHEYPLTRPTLQASAAYPENTLASFEAAMRDGAEGIESGIS